MDLTVEQLYQEKKQFLELHLLTENGQLGRRIPNNEIHRPGLALAGFTRRFAHQRTQVLGETELAFLTDKSPPERRHIMETLLSFDIPYLVVTKGIDPPLELVERGHRLVADDMVKISKKAPEVVVGTGSELLGHHMEIRGVGIIDLEKMFGIRSIRLQKRIEVEVRLVAWEEAQEYERVGS